MSDINKHNQELLDRIKDTAVEFDLTTMYSKLLNVAGMLDAVMDAQARIISKLENVDEKVVLDRMIMDANRYAVERFEAAAKK